MNTIILKNKHKKYFLFQRNEYLSKLQKKIRKTLGRYLFTNFFINYFNPIDQINKKLNHDFKIEFKELSKFLPSQLKEVLDIGSGLGIINIYINDIFKNNVAYTLIDKNYTEKKVYYGFNDKGQAYNDFKVTRDFLNYNGIDSKKLDLIDANSNYIIDKKFDLVLSLLSMGYHYPVDQYFEIFKKNTDKNTTFIFDIAKEYNDINKIYSLFDSVEIIKESNQEKHNYLRICCKSFKG